MTLIDANVLMYANGREHPNKSRSVEFLRRIVVGQIEAIVDAETLQEILHRYRSVNRWSEGVEIYEDARVFFPKVLDITAEVTDLAKALMDRHTSLTARDAVHVSVVTVYSLDSICSFDRDFDRIPGLKRIEP